MSACEDEALLLRSVFSSRHLKASDSLGHLALEELR